MARKQSVPSVESDQADLVHAQWARELPDVSLEGARILARAGRITRVEVSVDGGATWLDAALTGEKNAKCLVRFRLPWEWTGHPAVLQSRATDEKGRVQPTRQEWVARYAPANIFHHNAIVSWAVSSDSSRPITASAIA